MEQSTTQSTLWQAISAATQQLPFSQTKIERIFSVELREKEQGYGIRFLDGGGATLAGGCVVDKVDLRVGIGGKVFGFMVLSLSGVCITLEQVRSHYRTLLITEAPRGRSLDEATWHTATLPWGTLSFGFTERNPGCLARIAFDTKALTPP